ncbi:desulfoferrodoxin [Candidatus Micrarchaeota archaeon CG09_land_8_20_14_0_10_55_25]|nr:MAG: desulfoferrodoxin [Candidatus Micrarchaeota archaeon CG1_02_55_41]PIO02926.1 MAG: desulfoferrodoxin [Candidatus Micrarchaeota archaeon CG09_land_8_20_14_0_10_55_25]
MAEQFGVYRCEICGNVVSVVEPHPPELVCCGQAMTLLKAKTKEMEGEEKHVPVVQVEGNKVVVKIGSIPHPMEEKHFIELIQLFAKGKLIAEARLYPGQKPEATFLVEDASGLKAREYCNVHGLWG